MLQEPDYQKSPYTGMERQHWSDAVKYLLHGVFRYVKDMDAPVLVPRYEENITYPNQSTPEWKKKAEIFEGLAYFVLLSERPCPPPLLLSYPLMEISVKRKKWCKSNNIDEYIEKVLYKMITIFGDFINIYCVINNKPKKQNNKCIENCRESVLY